MLPSDETNSGIGRHPPLVSIVVPSYNHAKYISKAVESALGQDFNNFELLISDDASPDNSWEVISGFSDPRVRLFRQERNLGPVGNLVFLIKEARGKYIALLNSDDAWYRNKLSKQVTMMESQPHLGACFTWADMVDEHGKEISGPESIWNDVFRQPNRTQAEWLRYFFFKGNCLCHPSILMRKDIYDAVGFYNPGLKQLPDFDMWVRLVKHYPIHIIQENLVAHLRDGNNTSAVSPENSARNLTELIHIFESFFEGVSDELFVEGFAGDFRLQGVPVTSTRLRCEKLFLLLDSAFVHVSGRASAFSALMKYVTDPEFERVLRDEYCFTVFDFYRLTGTSGFGHYFMQAVNAGTPAVDTAEKGAAVMVKRAFYFLKRLIGRLNKAAQRH